MRKSKCFDLYDTVSESTTTSSSSSCDCIETYGANRRQIRVVEKIVPITRNILGTDQVFFAAPSFNMTNNQELSVGQFRSGDPNTELRTQIIGADGKLTRLILDVVVYEQFGGTGEIGSLTYTVMTYDGQLVPLLGSSSSISIPTIGRYRITEEINPLLPVSATNLITLILQFFQEQGDESIVRMGVSMSCKIEPL